MIKIESLPHKSAKIFSYDPAEAEEIAKLIDKAIKNNNTCLALGIKNCRLHKRKPYKIILEVKDCINDNWKDMCAMFGLPLTQRIKSF